MSVGKNIERVRKAAKLSQAELARLLKISRSSVNEYESGKHEPNFSMLRRIAKVTKTDVADLFA